MFSITTMELSTNIPIPSASPDSEMMFNVICVKYISTTAKTTLSGIEHVITSWDSLTFVKDPASGPVAENLFPDRPARRDDFYSELCTKRSRGKALVWTLEQGGNIVCTVGAYALCNGQAYMACGQTAEALRGQRVGGRLIVQMANALSAQGDQPVFLCSPERVHFYTQLGFHPLGTLARYESPIGKD